MIKVFVTLVLCSCMKEKLWPTTNDKSVDDIPTTRPPCNHDSTLVTSSPIDNTTLITSQHADDVTLPPLLFDEILATTPLPVSNITSTVLFPTVNVTLTPTASINNVTRLSPEVVDHTHFTTELANDIPRVTELVDNVTSTIPSLIETVTSKTTEFINDTPRTITELSNHITSPTTELFDSITFTPLSVDNITLPIAGSNVNNDPPITELVNDTTLTTTILPVNDISLTTSSPLNFSSTTEGMVGNVTLPAGETFDNITLITKSVHNTTSKTESVNNVTSMISSAFNFSSTTEGIIDDVILTPVEVFENTTSKMKSITNGNMTNETIDNITLTTLKNLDDTTPTMKSVNDMKSMASSVPSFTSSTAEITGSSSSITLNSFDNNELNFDDDSVTSSLLPIDNIPSTLSQDSNTLAALSPLLPEHTSKEFKIYWNVPTFMCLKYDLNFEHISKFGITQNNHDAWRGKDVAILYDPGLFPALIRSSNGSIIIRNGGVPQKGDLQKHLEAFKQDINAQVDENFSGVGIIDFEHWRPILRLNWESSKNYKQYSYKIEKKENPDLNEKEIKQLASEKFGKYARVFMERTIKMAKALRPKASWTYYGFPGCNNLTPRNNNTQCHPMFIEYNNDIQWLWDQEAVLAPSIYLPLNLNRNKRVDLINGRLNEARRIARKTNSQPKILPYLWFKYRDRRDVFVSKDDLIESFKEMLNQNIDGFILWGSSNDVNTKAKCQQVYDYINQVLGPLVKNMIVNERRSNRDVFKK